MPSQERDSTLCAPDTVPSDSQQDVADTVPAALEHIRHPATPATPPPMDGDPERLWARLASVPEHRAQHFGDALVKTEVLTTTKLEEALRYQARQSQHLPFGEVLVQLGLLNRAQLRVLLAEWMDVPTVDLDAFVPEAEALSAVPATLAMREGVLPLMVRGDTLVIAMSDPWDQRLLEMLRFTAQLRPRPVLPKPGSMAGALARAYRVSVSTSQGGGASDRSTEQRGPARPTSLFELARELEGGSEALGGQVADVVSESDNTLVRVVNRLISDAIDLRASDIHIETFEPPRPVRVRLRIDGDLRRYLELPSRVRLAIVARLKIMAELDISEHRRPQDGKLDFSRFGTQRMEVRMVTVPTSGGLEDVVLRLLGSVKPLPLDRIGLLAANVSALRLLMAKPHGLLLVCGPTGCGKTTTLHSLMRELNEEKRKIWTAEDPIEISQDGLRQVQVNSRIGWTFAAAMRTFLRADPDVIMIGEMRDEETARIAVEASLTGHLVLSTVHTNSAPESVTRLLEIGLDPFMFSDSLQGVLAQRLVRRLCTECCVSEPLDERLLHSMARLYLQGETGDGAEEALIERWRKAPGQLTALRQHRRQGCSVCNGTGYHGRLGIHELLVADETLRQLIRRRASAPELFAAARAAGMKTLRQDGIEKVLAGLTDLPEVLAATSL